MTQLIRAFRVCASLASGVAAILGLTLTGHAAAEPGNIVFETEFARLSISSNGQTVAVTDRATGRNWLRGQQPVPFALIRANGAEAVARSATLSGDKLALQFDRPEFLVKLSVTQRPTHVVFRVESVTGAGVESLTFLNAPLGLRGRPQEPVGACALALNLHTRVDALPALQSELRAVCEKGYGFEGAKAAFVLAPMERMLPALQAALAADSELPNCNVAGPWARETPFAHGSYLFNFGALTETNAPDWIEMARSLGFTQIDNHGGGAFFRFGDMELNRERWPGGWDAYQRIVARLHANGIGSIFHTYAFFIDKRSKYVAPVPDPRLDAFRTFTLAEAVSADASEIEVREPLTGMKTVTGFFEFNSVVLHLGDELVTFGGVTSEAPWRFTGVQRGALGTRASAHAGGTAARHLKECFGLFVPNPESTLFEEIAANHADVVNRCGFDGIYLDAIDGSSILRGPDACWYWANRFVVEIQKRLKRPVGMEMSAMWHQFWQYRTRWQAWDYPQRGHLRFVDEHAESVNGGLLLPLHLGWWNFQSFDPPQIEPTYPEVMETLGARMIGWDAGLSLTGGVDRKALRNTPLFRRAVETLRLCEELRHGKGFEEAALAGLRESGREFAILRDAEGAPSFRPARSHRHVVAAAEPWTSRWRLTNEFAAQPMRLRIEALMSTDAGSTQAVVIAGAGAPELASWTNTSAAGVTLGVTADASGWVIAARQAGKVERRAAWGRLQRGWDPLVNLKDCQALDVEVEGDGSGALLAVRLESPAHLAFGAVADRYAVIDFVGRRRLALVETESTRWNDYIWNDGKSLYNVHRETIDFKAVERASVWVQNIPPGRETQLRVGAIRAVPMRAVPVRHPRLEIDGQRVEFLVELAPGSWIEGSRPDDCQVYGPKGERLGAVQPRGVWPVSSGQPQAVSFSCGSPEARARITLQELSPVGIAPRQTPPSAHGP
jgi:hypothetical protein